MLGHICYVKFIELSKNGTNILAIDNVRGAKYQTVKMLETSDENMNLK